MFRKECVAATYNEKSKTLVMFNEKALKVEDREISR